jgi:hypothetical protein
MKFSLLIFSVAFYLVNAKEINVSNSKQFQDALNSVKPGDIINLADGSYKGPFKASISGTSSNPITVTGSRKAVVSSDGYGFHLTADNWVLNGFTVANCKKGIMLDSANNNVLNKLYVHHVEEEAVHFRENSCDNTIRNSEISHTGLGKGKEGFGEGVYIGSALSNWESKSKPDKSNRNKVLNNIFGPNISAEAIDIKEGTEGGIIDGNTFDGTGMSGENYADSWIDVKGSKYVISKNTGKKSLLDGFQVKILK